MFSRKHFIDTWDPVRGCSYVSRGCDNCNAVQTVSRALKTARTRGSMPKYDGLVDIGGIPRWTGEIIFDVKKLAEPLSWRTPKWVIVNDRSDLFHEKLTNEQIAAVFGVMAACSQHTFVVFTKRYERMREWFRWAHGLSDLVSLQMLGYSVEALGYEPAVKARRPAELRWPLSNLILGVSVEDQATVDARLPALLAVPAAVRAIRAEPLLGPLYLTPYLTGTSPNWVVAGCEIGFRARLSEIDWYRSLRDACVAARVPLFLKQATVVMPEAWMTVRPNGELSNMPIESGGDPSLLGSPYPLKLNNVVPFPLLDGVQWVQYPEIAR